MAETTPEPSDVYALLSRRQRGRRTRRALQAIASEAGQSTRLPRVRGPGSRAARLEWILLPTLALTAFLLVLVGDGDFEWDEDLLKGLDAFTSGFPSEPDADGSAVTVGRMLAPTVALYTTVRLVTVLYAQRIREWHVRRMRGHTVVVGLGETGLRAVRQFRSDGATVVAISQEPFGPAAEVALGERAYVVAGSGTDPATLHAAGIAGAARILCAESDDVSNVQVALEAVDAHRARSNEPLELLAEAAASSPAAALLGAAATSGSVTLFSLREVWAWRLLAAGPLWRYHVQQEPPPDVVVVGATELGAALVDYICRWWHFDAREQQARERLRLVVIDPDADTVCDDAVERHPELVQTVELGPLALDLGEAFEAVVETVGRTERHWAVYVCLDASDRLRLTSAQVIRQRLAGLSDGVVVVAVSAQVKSEDHSEPVVVAVAADDPERGFDLARFGPEEALARATHGVYERHLRAEGDVAAPALRPFDELAPHLMDSNRAQARSIRSQLVSVLRTTAPLRNWDRVQDLGRDEIEVLSELEHLRWCEERKAAGWARGPSRDDVRRTHPDLVPWSELPEERREINRSFMRARPRTLARVGEAIVPHPAREQLARLTHERYREVVGPQAVEWGDLPQAERIASRAFVDDIPAKLLVAGWRIVEGLAEPPVTLTDEDVDRLARVEHDRWAAFRGGPAWVGAGGSSRPHPRVVAWAELGEQERDVDRALVRAIPRLVHEAGLGLTPARPQGGGLR